ncbi:MAG: hypothetical protein KGL48_04035 [Sphingomonadales bacterium]|nr:hypothetical protein [Sphingomonadales bacterium]MDE2570454.1 hypothetical protein [Sphingomonadales bacterium]
MTNDPCPARPAPYRWAVSFIVDDDAVFPYMAWHLAHSVLKHTQLGASDIHVQFTPEVSSEVVELFRQLGCCTHRMARFGDGRYCNKLAQWENLRNEAVDHVVFLDTDMICLDDITTFLPRSAIGGKVVDLANPRLPLLDLLFERAGFIDRPPIVDVEASDERTYQGNCNGGFYSVPTQYADALFEAWRRRATMLLADIEPLRAAKKENHVDQIAFCMALHDTGLPFEGLPSNVNYYIHFQGAHCHFDSARPLALLHYHTGSLNVLGLLEPAGAVESYEKAAVAKANRQIGCNFDSRLFWDMRYRHFPERGSGVGSRGEKLIYKRELLKAEGIEKASSVLDIGCGDLEVVGAFDLHNYVGLDQSAECLTVARAKRPEWAFLQAPTIEAKPADFVVCLEVSIHQPSFGSYKSVIEFAAARTQRRLIISGYDHLADHVGSNHMIFFHEPLETSLKETGRFSSITKIGTHSDVSIYRCDID